MTYLEIARQVVKDQPSVSWLREWEKVADLVYGVTAEDTRLPGIMDALRLCDAAFEQDDWAAFYRGVEKVKRARAGQAS
jgi:hypothetical protein